MCAFGVVWCLWCGVPAEASSRAPRGLLFLAFSGFSFVPLVFPCVLSFSLAFSCFASLPILWHFLLNGCLAFPHSPLLSLAFPCLPSHFSCFYLVPKSLEKIALPVRAHFFKLFWKVWASLFLHRFFELVFGVFFSRF